MVDPSISDAARAMLFLSEQLTQAEYEVESTMQDVLMAQKRLSFAIDKRDAIQRTLNLTARYVATETRT